MPQHLAHVAKERAADLRQLRAMSRLAMKQVSAEFVLDVANMPRNDGPSDGPGRLR